MAAAKHVIPGDETVHYESPRSKRSEGTKNIQPPLTPMIDVTFQLLLYFLLTSTFREKEGVIPGSLPAVPSMQQLPTPPIPPVTLEIRPLTDFVGQISASEDFTKAVFILEGQRMESQAALLQKLKSRREQVSDKTPAVIKPSGNVKWEYIVGAFNALVHARFEKIAFSPAM